MPRKRILIVDDERLLVKSTAMALEYSGYEALCVYDGNAGIALAREDPPDMILLDIMMPGMDGWQVLSELKDDERTRDIPVVIFTAREYSDGRQHARERGAHDFIAKPFELDELDAVVRGTLAER